MKRSKRIGALLLAMLIVVSLVSACSSAQKETQTSSSPATATTETKANEPAAAISAEPSTAALAEYNLPLTDTPVTLTYMALKFKLMPPLDTEYNLTAWADFPTVKYAEKITGVHIDYVELPMETLQEQFNLTIASGDLFDIMSMEAMGMNLYNGGLQKAYDDNIVINLSDYLDKDAPNYTSILNSDPSLKKALEVDGSIYKFASLYNEYRNNQGLILRKDWLDKLGLQAPDTFDELYNVLKAFKTNYNTKCTFNFDNSCAGAGITSGFEINPLNLSGNSSGLTYIQRDGVVECSILSDGYRQYIEMCNKWYKEGLLPEDFFSMAYDPNSADLRENIGSGQCGVWNGLYESIEQWKSYSNDANFEVTPIANLVMQEGDKDMVTEKSLFPGGSVSVTTKCKNPDIAVKWLDFWFSEQGKLLYNYGVPDEAYTLVDGKPQYTDVIVNNKLGLSVGTISRAYCPYAGMQYGYYEPTRLEPYLTDLEKSAWDTWTNCVDGSYAFPSTVTLSGEESEEISAINADLLTYISENVPLFINGEKPMSDWSGFVDGMKSMDINRCVEIEQAALDSYNGK